MDHAGPQSLFIVVSYKFNAPYFSSILQLDTNIGGHEPRKITVSSYTKKRFVINYEYVAHFQHPPGYPPIRYVFSHLPSSPEGLSSPEDLCMIPDWGPVNYQMRAPLQGCIFNLRTKECKSIESPGSSRYFKHVVDLGGHIYFMGAPCPNYEPGAFFARYNRRKDSWQTLKPFPYHDVKHRGDAHVGTIASTAVWKNTILLTMVGCGMWAYDVDTNKWYPVVNEDNWCDKIVGKAIVCQNTIYALMETDAIVVALSIEKKEIKDDHVFICSLQAKIKVPGLDEVEYDERRTWWTTRALVYLGGNNFCLVQSCNSHVYETIGYQPIQVTNLILTGKYSMRVANISVHEIKLVENEQFDVKLCFSLPEDMTTAIKLGNRSVFNFDPFPEDYPSKPILCYEGYPSLNAHFTSKPFQDKDSLQMNTTGEGDHSIKLGVLPPDATVSDLEKRLRKFGPIKRDGIRLFRRKELRYANVEFETATSKRQALEAATITVGDCQVEIFVNEIVWSTSSYAEESPQWLKPNKKEPAPPFVYASRKSLKPNKKVPPPPFVYAAQKSRQWPSPPSVYAARQK